MRTQRIFVIGGPRAGRAPADDAANPLEGLLPAGNPRHLRNPWPDELARIGATERVLVLGSGLAAVNVVLELDERGHRAPVRLVSSHRELLKRPRLAPAVAAELTALLAAGRLELLAGEVRGAAAYGDTFVVDVLPHGRSLHLSERYDWIVSCAAEAAHAARPPATRAQEHACT